MKIALASPPYPHSISDGLYQAERLITDSVKQQIEIICFPESYIPGYPSDEYPKEEITANQLESALQQLSLMAAQNRIAIIMPMDWYNGDRFFNVAHVISSTGELLGYQTKNQLDPSEDGIWIPGTRRNIFEVNGLKFGIVICHEGFRYPETVRWAAQRDAKIVFHPHFTGSDTMGLKLEEWGDKHAPYYEKAMMMRALENTIYFASVGYATHYHESATAIIDPDGWCLTSQPYGQSGVLMAEIDPAKATGLLAKRFKPETYL